MTNDQITALALANGFKLKEQPDGSEALNPYVFDFARALLAASEAPAEPVAWVTPEMRASLEAVTKYLRSSEQEIPALEEKYGVAVQPSKAPIPAKIRHLEERGMQQCGVVMVDPATGKRAVIDMERVTWFESQVGSIPAEEQNARFAIEEAINFGREGVNPPPSPDHWLMPFWKMGKKLGELK